MYDMKGCFDSESGEAHKEHDLDGHKILQRTIDLATIAVKQGAPSRLVPEGNKLLIAYPYPLSITSRRCHLNSLQETN